MLFKPRSGTGIATKSANVGLRSSEPTGSCDPLPPFEQRRTPGEAFRPRATSSGTFPAACQRRASAASARSTKSDSSARASSSSRSRSTPLSIRRTAGRASEPLGSKVASTRGALQSTDTARTITAESSARKSASIGAACASTRTASTPRTSTPGPRNTHPSASVDGTIRTCASAKRSLNEARRNGSLPEEWESGRRGALVGPARSPSARRRRRAGRHRTPGNLRTQAANAVRCTVSTKRLSIGALANT